MYQFLNMIIKFPKLVRCKPVKMPGGIWEIR